MRKQKYTYLSIQCEHIFGISTNVRCQKCQWLEGERNCKMKQSNCHNNNWKFQTKVKIYRRKGGITSSSPCAPQRLRRRIVNLNCVLMVFFQNGIWYTTHQIIFHTTNNKWHINMRHNIHEELVSLSKQKKNTASIQTDEKTSS